MKTSILLLVPFLGACFCPAMPSQSAGSVAQSPAMEPPQTAAPIPQRAAPPEPAGAEGSLRQVMLTRHNSARAAMNVPPLVWSDALQASAQAYADDMAAMNRFGHAQQQGVREGENLWMGTRGAYSYSDMVDSWIEKGQYYVSGPAPNNSRNGVQMGHYTQVIWRGSTQLGCAVSENQSKEFLVCRYAPRGNAFGQVPEKS